MLLQMLPYHNIDPIIYTIKPFSIFGFTLGPFSIAWYGVMYLLGFLSSYLLVAGRLKKKSDSQYMDAVQDIYFYMIIGLIIGARLGYAIFYNLSFYLSNPLEIFFVNHGGMSFHGGLIGTFLAAFYIIRKKNLEFWFIADIIIVTAPIGLFLGRCANFINGELFGRVTSVPWAMVFPQGGPEPRHPSQLYEAILEGLLLFVILWIIRNRVKINGSLFALFLVLYGLFRFIIEFFREPDEHVGYFFTFFTEGQLLCTGMIIFGIFLYQILKKQYNLKNP